MSVYLDDGDVRLYHGDALEVLRTLPSSSVDMVATSPPFYGLRDYGTGEWQGGDEGCDHRSPASGAKSTLGVGYDGSVRVTDQGRERAAERSTTPYRDVCGKCGARRVDRQIGLEETPQDWVDNLVSVFRECRRVLADHGTLWVEIGDSYANTEHGRNDTAKMYGEEWTQRERRDRRRAFPPNVKQKDMLGQPWLLAFALRADGWYLRSEIIWARPNPMPESVTDRPTKSHSTIFLLSKQPRYFYDADAIRQPHQTAPIRRTSPTDEYAAGITPSEVAGKPVNRGGRALAYAYPDGVPGNPNGANARSVWNIPTEPTPFAHFATWPQKLVGRMIQAGTSQHGKCGECGNPWMRDVEIQRPTEQTPRIAHLTKAQGAGAIGGIGESSTRSTTFGTAGPTVRTLGWSPSCPCDSPPVPCTVLDPFAGSGTTLLTARNHQRHAIGIELNPQYCQIAATRLQQLSLLA